MAMEKQRKTFLSYSRVNKEFAIRLARELKAEGFDIWLDQIDIQPGAWWDDEVERALEESEIFMVIITPSSSASKNVKDEIGYALDNQKRILPILLENATLPLRLRRLQYVDFTAKGFDEGVNAAKDLLRKLISQPTLPRVELSEKERQQLAQADVDRKAKEEAERIAAEHAETERLAQQKVEEERVAKARAEEERLALQKAEAEQLAKAGAKRKAREEKERLDAQKAEEARLAAARAEEERLAKETVEQEQLAKAEEERSVKQRAAAERKAREAERLSRKQSEQKSASTSGMPLVPVTAEAAQPSIRVPAAPRKPVARGVMYGVAAFVLVCSGIGYGILSFLNRPSPSTPPDQVANTAVKTPTDIPAKVNIPTNTSIPIPEATARPTNTSVPTSAPTVIEVDNFTAQGTWRRVENCPENKNPCWQDSPSDHYVDNMYYTITSDPILVDATWGNPYLVYWQKYNTEGQYDFLQISINDLAVRANSGTQDWHQIAVNLESFQGQKIVISFLIATDYSIVGDGWYLHDIRVVPNATSQELQSARIVEP